MISWRLRLLAARSCVPSPRRCLSRYIHHDTWHVCLHQQHLVSSSYQWIEVAW